MIHILYENTDLVIVNKQAGLLSVPGLVSPDNLLDRVKKVFPNARVVHRLDMATSGIIIFALNYETQKQMGKLFEQRKIHKTYIAEIYGNLANAEGEINVPMLCDWENRPKQKVHWLDGKKAVTYFSVLDKNNRKNSTRVLLKPYTGRSHQLRVHSFYLGHPILGDQLYNINGSEKTSERLLLHASTIEFSHPSTEELIKINCEPDF